MMSDKKYIHATFLEEIKSIVIVIYMKTDVLLSKLFIISSLGIKKITGVNWGRIKKRMHKHIMRIFYKKKYSANDIVSIMKDLGMKEGSLVCIHCAMAEFFNYQGTAKELIEKILLAIGPTGTLMMPAFPIIPKGRDSYVFNPKTDKTGAGFLAETFRNYEGVKRSLNARASVCAVGPLAEYLIEEHHKGYDCWDEKSPWYKLCINNGLVFNFGLPRSYMGTFYHCVESKLKNEHPYWRQFFNKEKIYAYSIDGVIYTYKNVDCDIYRRTKEKRIMRYFTEEDWKIRRLSNLRIKVFYTGHLFPKLVELGRLGITAYYLPSPKKFDFSSQNTQK